MPKYRIPVESQSELEVALGYKFEKQSLLRQALTHSTAIKEEHPDAADCDLGPLAFAGDAALKHAVARYLFLNGKNDVIRSCAKLHDKTQLIITNDTLAAIALNNFHIEKYLIRGNGHKTLSKDMYASCMEAILGAITLDCGNDQQPVFLIVDNICSQCYENWFRENMVLVAAMYDLNKEERWKNMYNIIWPKKELEAALRDRQSATPSHQDRALQKL